MRFGKMQTKLAAAVLAPVLAIFAGAGSAGAITNFSAKNFHGSFACRAQFENVFSQLMQLSADGKGGISGSAKLNFEGEVCLYNLAGGYAVNSDGTGTLHLDLSLQQTADQDGDIADCSTVLGATPSEDFVMVLENNAKRVEMEANDAFFSGSQFTTDTGDFIFPGSCTAQ
jgi:hypothetical protein